MTNPTKDGGAPKKPSAPLYVIPIIMMLLLIYLRAGGGSAYHYTPQPPRQRITAINPDAPALAGLKEFARTNKLKWQVSPDEVDGTSYCADLYTEGKIAVGCDDDLRKATQDAIDDWKSKALTIGGSR